LTEVKELKKVWIFEEFRENFSGIKKRRRARGPDGLLRQNG